MVQSFPELQGIYPGLPVSVIKIMLIQIRTGKLKRSDLFAVSSEPDLLKISPHAQVKRPPKKVRGLHMARFHAKSPPFACIPLPSGATIFD